jgi:hypothetical protein
LELSVEILFLKNYSYNDCLVCVLQWFVRFVLSWQALSRLPSLQADNTSQGAVAPFARRPYDDAAFPLALEVIT